ncbi:hypothetical protein [Mesorhizobium sp.]|uniref:hypothetical protein n=1 Tax=Mesorhizobium sp. TaxID=1871066 RepID=UPI000FE673DA|nr:hypothetical protein [Mesorhizobium sp.]RWI92729.1 MAG: hypothetical protein EOR22_18575 [Mesorhizobium sp.]TIQ07759.1 MAG: hypothetical protein E5X50_15540 [Mesorhizobium sp.]TIR22575.1 MAG: hypothetical protein E5X33_07105 [Mesorhizobium sp.]
MIAIIRVLPLAMFPLCSSAAGGEVEDALELLKTAVRCPVRPHFLTEQIKEIREAKYIGDANIFSIRIDKEQANVSDDGERYPFKSVNIVQAPMSTIGGLAVNGSTVTVGWPGRGALYPRELD